MAKKNSNLSASDTPSVKSKFKLSSEEKITYGILLGIIFLIVLIRSNFYNIPFERDEGAYSYYGKLLLEGKIPYKDFYEQKFPGIFFFYAFMVGIFGETVKGMHFGFMLLNITTVILLFSASKRLFSNLAGLVTAFTYAIVSMTPTLSGFTVQSEHGVAFFVSLGLFIYSYTRNSTNWKNYFLLGLVMGTAFMTKTTGVFLVLWAGLVIVTDFFLDGGKRTVKEFFRRTLLYSSGVLLIIGILFLIIAMKGSFKEMLFWTYDIPKRYVSRVPWEEGKKYLEYSYDAITKDYKLFWFHSIAGLAVVFIKNIPLRLKISMILLAFFSALTIFPGYYFYGHYWIQILPGLAILAGLTFHWITDLLKSSFGIKNPKLPYAYLIVFVIAGLLHLNRLKDYYFNPNYERVLRYVYGNNPFPETAKIAEYINANSTPEDNIVSIGSEPQIYFYTKKHCPSRHAYFSAMVDSVAEHKAWQREFVADVEKAKPRYVVFYNHPISLMVQRGVDQYVFEWYNKYVTENYNMIGLVDMIEGYSSTYVWKEQLATYQPQAQNRIYIFERKKGT